jgi:hypothetical protein
MAPDLAFIGPMRDDSVFSHTLSAQVWFTAPLTCVLVWMVSGLLLPALLPYLRDHPSWRLHDLAALEAPHGWRGWASVALSGCLGGVSHVVLDGMTHGNHSGWLVPMLPFLRTLVPHFGGPIPLYDVLQIWLTVAFAIASLLMWRTISRGRLLWRWRRRPMTELPRMPRVAGERLLMLCAVSAVYGMLVGGLLHRGDPLKPLLAGVGFGAIDFVLGALVLTAVTMRFQARPDVPTASIAGEAPAAL